MCRRISTVVRSPDRTHLLARLRGGDERRDRGIVLAQLDRLQEAISEIQSYLQSRRDMKTSKTTREQLKRLQIRLSTLS